MQVGDVVDAICYRGIRRPAIVLAVKVATQGELLNLVTLSPHDVQRGPHGRATIFLDEVPQARHVDKDVKRWTWEEPNAPQE